MQGFLNDKENEIPSITLDFKKKVKSKPNSERTNSSSSLLRAQNAKMICSSTLNLLQKKKQYSQSIREKHMPKQAKKSQIQQALEQTIRNKIEKFNVEALKTSNFHSANNSQYYSTNTKMQSQRKKSTKSFLFHPSPSKKDEKTKPRDAKKQKGKIQQISMIQGAKDHNFNENFSVLSISPNFAIEQTLMNQQFSVIQKINDLSRIERKPQLCSRQIDQCIGPFENEQQKQIQLIKKQNSTFKKQLATFRRENASLRRETEQLKKQLAVFQQRNQYLQNQSSQQYKMLQSLQMKVSESIETFPELQLKDQSDSLASDLQNNDQKLKQIISNYQNELFQAKKLNKKLQFRNYILQKRLLDESQIHKKQMAKEISIWKQRYIKARNENMRLKDSRSQMLFQMSISQQM